MVVKSPGESEFLYTKKWPHW